MSIWTNLETAAADKLAVEIEKDPFDRGEVERLLQEFAIAKNADPHVAQPSYSILSDEELRGMVRALLAGNVVGK